MRTLVRIQPWWWRGRGVAGVAPATTSAAAGARVRAGLALRGASGQGEALARLSAGQQARWTRVWDQMVTGALPPTSSGGGAVRSTRGRWLRGVNELGKRGNRRRISQWRRRDGQRARGRVGDDRRAPAISAAERLKTTPWSWCGASGVLRVVQEA